MSMLNLKELDSMHLSVLAEIGNIGSGNAATALAGLLNTPVDIEVPNIYEWCYASDCGERIYQPAYQHLL